MSIILTGASGHVGSAVLEHLLASGHSVIAVLRSFAKTKLSFEAQYPQEVSSGALSFVEIPDLAAQDAFHNIATGPSILIHVATPVERANFEESLIIPTEVITKSILEAAESSPTLRRVIITGSLTAVMNITTQMLDPSLTFSEKDYNDITLQDAVQSMQGAYGYAKANAERKAWEYMRQGKRSFDLIVLVAPQVYGKSRQPGFKAIKNYLGGVAAIYRELFDRETVGTVFPYAIDVDDLAELHLKSLDPAIPGNERYILSPYLMTTAKISRAIRAKYPLLRARVPDATGQNETPTAAKVDGSKAVKVFGMSWLPWEESVYAVVEGILKSEAEEV